MDVIKIKRLWCWWIANKWNSILWTWSNNSSQSYYWKISCSWGATANPREIWLQKKARLNSWLDWFVWKNLDSFYYKTPVYLVNFSNNAHYGHFIKYINLLNIIKQTKLPSKCLYILINSIEYGHKGNKRLTIYTKTYRTGYISIPTATGTRCLYHGHIWHTLGRVPADSREFIQMGTLKIISFLILFK